MRSWPILLALVLALAGCKAENARVEIRTVRTILVDPKPILDDRQVIGEVKPRYESDLSFRVDGKLVSRRVDVGAAVKQGNILATLDVQDYQKSSIRRKRTWPPQRPRLSRRKAPKAVSASS